MPFCSTYSFFFFFNDTATTEIYTLSLHDALPISMKYVGIWWGMHIGTMTWSSGPKHGATTANAKRYIDFAAANGLGGAMSGACARRWPSGWLPNWKSDELRVG